MSQFYRFSLVGQWAGLRFSFFSSLHSVAVGVSIVYLQSKVYLHSVAVGRHRVYDLLNVRQSKLYLVIPLLCSHRVYDLLTNTLSAEALEHYQLAASFVACGAACCWSLVSLQRYTLRASRAS